MELETAERVGRVLKAVGHPVRLRIIELLEKGPVCVGDIVEALGEKQAIISQHLNIMRDRGILSCKRDGVKVYYEVENKNVIKLLYCVYKNCESSGKVENEQE